MRVHGYSIEHSVNSANYLSVFSHSLQLRMSSKHEYFVGTFCNVGCVAPWKNVGYSPANFAVLRLTCS